mgnify:CR=1 FL=1
MKQEDKNLLLEDLCARLPYGVILNVTLKDKYDEIVNRDIKMSDGNLTYITRDSHWKTYKPYLRPMSSMTEEEENLFSTFRTQIRAMNNYNDFAKECNKLIDWLNKKMFDYRGLIPKGLALEAPEGMYKIEER